jgi:hypothetical protein
MHIAHRLFVLSFQDLKTTNMEMVLVQQAKKEKGGKGKW